MSAIVDDLRSAAKTLAEEDWPFTARICRRAADRMEDMESLLVKLQKSVDKIEDEL